MIKSKSINIYGIVACHNRRDHTMRFLTSLFSQTFPDYVDFKLYLYDDKSTDGTSEMVSIFFPQVKVIRGDGNSFWAGGMRATWECIRTDIYNTFSYIIVFNDDIELFNDAFQRMFNILLDHHLSPERSFALVLSMRNYENEFISYGGLENISRYGGFTFKLIEPDSYNLKSAETLNMNAAILSAAAIKKVGFLDKAYAHQRADIDYGYRLVKQQGEVLVAPGIFGYCDSLSPRSFDLNTNKSFIELVKNTLHKKNDPILERLIFYKRHGGFLWPIFYLLPYLFMFAPNLRVKWSKSKFFSKL
jgi:GT2 family glycosyltransferase